MALASGKGKKAPPPFEQIPDSMRVEPDRSNGGRPLSALSQSLLDGKTMRVEESINRDNYDKTFKSYGYRLRTVADPNKPGYRRWWLEPLEG